MIGIHSQDSSGSQATPTQRGIQNEIYVANRPDNVTGTGTKDDPYNSGSDLTTLWPTIKAASPKLVMLYAGSYGTSGFLEGIDNCFFEGNGSTIQLLSNYWTGPLGGEFGMFGESNLTGTDTHNNVWIENFVIDLNNDNQTGYAGGAYGARNQAIWLRGSKNIARNIRVFNFGNTYDESIHGHPAQEGFPILIGSDGLVEECQFDAQATFSKGTLTLIGLSEAHNSPGSGHFRGTLRGNKFFGLHTPSGAQYMAMMNLQSGSHALIEDNLVYDFDGSGSCVYHDTGSATENTVRLNRFLRLRYSSGGMGNAGGINITQASQTNTRCVYEQNLITLGLEAFGISLNTATFADCIVKSNRVSKHSGESAPPFGINCSNMTGGSIDDNYVDPNINAGTDGNYFGVTGCTNTVIRNNMSRIKCVSVSGNTNLHYTGNRSTTDGSLFSSQE